MGACPLGSLQAALGKRGRFPAYVLGTLLLFGVLLGRLVCGFLCPFGLLQDLLDRVPLPKLKVPKRLDKPLRYLKYAVLVLLVVLAFLLEEPAFCKFLCPAGLLEAGLLNEGEGDLIVENSSEDPAKVALTLALLDAK